VSSIRYSNEAERDLNDIVDYTLDVWGADQALQYLSELEGCFNSLAAMPSMGRACPRIYPGLYRIERGRHVIFYRPEPGGVFICRVLHQQMLPTLDYFIHSIFE
jgi:toxin ParE1/3/4